MATISVNSTATLTTALASAKAGDTIVLASGVYSGVKLANFNFSGAPVTITSQDPAHPAVFTNFTMGACSGLAFSNLELSTVGSTDPYYAFRVTSCQNISFDSLNVHGDVGGDPSTGITAFLIRSSNGVSVTNSHFEYVQTGLQHLNDNGLIFAGNTFDYMGLDGIDGGGSSNVQILNNYFSDTHAAAGAHPDAIQFWTQGTTSAAHDITISGNTVVRGDGVPSQGIFLRDELGTLPYQNVTITNNVVDGGLYNGIMIDGAINPIISGNTVQAYADQTSWIRLENVIGALLSNNAASAYQIDTTNSNISESGDTSLPPVPPPISTDPPPPPPPPGPTAPVAPTGLSLDASTNSGSIADTVTNQGQVRIDGTAQAGSTVTLYDGTTLIGTGVADATTGAFSILLNSALSDGAHGLTATASNANGQSTSSSALSLLIDTHPAAAALAHASANASFNGTTATLSGTSGDGVAGVGYTVTVLQDGVPIGVLTPSSGNWSMTASNVTNSVHVYSVTTMDAAGNAGAGSDVLYLGTSGQDTIVGGASANVIVGGAGADTLTGGSGTNTFIYNAASDAPIPNGRGNAHSYDTITNWVSGADHLDLSAMGHLAFGGQTQTVSANSVEWYVSGGNTYIVGETGQGHGKTDFMIELLGVHNLTASDFVLG